MRLLEQINRGVLRELNQAGRATSPEMIAGAKALKKEIKKTLGVPGHGKPSAPGEPPRKQEGKLQKSVVSGAVGGAQGVGLTDFVAPLQQFGVDTKADVVFKGAGPRSRRNLFTGEFQQVKKASIAAFARKVRRRQAGSAKTRDMKLEPRPFMERSIAAAKDQMVDVTVGTLRRRLSDTL